MLRSILSVLLLSVSYGTALSTEPAGKIRFQSGIPFAKIGDTALKLDLAMPAQTDKTYPALICIHGGGWTRGSREQMRSTIQVLAHRGYVAISIDYRLAPISRFPAQIEDCKAAVRWLRAQAKAYRVNPEKIGALGFSAGAHLATLLGVTGKVQSVVSFFAPLDLTDVRFNETVKKDNLLPLLGGSLKEKRELYQQASPMHHVKKGAPPFLFFHGTEDKIVPIQQAELMVKKLKSVGTSAKLITMKGKGHGWGGKALVESLEQMMQFFDQTLKQQP